MGNGAEMTESRPPKLSAFYPLSLRQQLQDAAKRKDYAEIDRITDALVRAGLVRPRSSDEIPRSTHRPAAVWSGESVEVGTATHMEQQ